MFATYILEGKRAVKCDDLVKWKKWYQETNRRVANETIDGVRVSTILLSIVHSFGQGPLMLFETLVFGGALDMAQERSATWEEAEVMHAAMVDRVRRERVAPSQHT